MIRPSFSPTISRRSASCVRCWLIIWAGRITVPMRWRAGFEDGEASGGNERNRQARSVPVEAEHLLSSRCSAVAEAAGNVVGHRELMDRAWPNLVVAEGSLRVTIAGLRKDLGDGQNGARYIANVTGRGYCLVAPVTRSLTEPVETAPVPHPAALPRATDRRLPPQLPRMVGRNDAVETLATLLVSRRFVSVVGPAGVGKTTVAISVGHAVLDVQ
jgi:DNA-binding winged helix-turn-helix (wHTH) protein